MREWKGHRIPHWRSLWKGIWENLRKRNIGVYVTGEGVRLLGAWALGWGVEVQTGHLLTLSPRVSYILSLCLSSLHLENGKSNNPSVWFWWRKESVRVKRWEHCLASDKDAVTASFVGKGAVLLCSWVPLTVAWFSPVGGWVPEVKCERAHLWNHTTFPIPNLSSHRHRPLVPEGKK